MIAWFETGVAANLDGALLMAGLAGLGLAVGVLTGLFGVGGAFMVTPLLNVLFGIPYPQAVASSLSFTIGTSASGVRRHLRLGNYELRSIVMLACGAVAGSLLGGETNVFLQGVLGESSLTLTMHGLFAVLLVVAALIIAWPSPSASGRKSLLQRLPIGPRIDLPSANLHGVSVTGTVATGMLMGFTSGMMGIGGGVLMVPLLVTVLGLSPHKAVGTSLGVIVVSALVGTVFYCIKGEKDDVNLWIVMPLLFGSAVGIQIGAAICDRLHQKRLKQYFAVVLFVTAVIVASDFIRNLV